MKILYLFSSAETSVAIVTLNQIKALRKYYPELEIKIACVNYYPERSILDGEIDYLKEFDSNKIINYIKSLAFVKRVKKEFKPDITISNLAAVNSFNSLIGDNEKKIGIFHAPMKQFSNKSGLTKFLNNLALKLIYPKLNILVGISNEVVLDLKNRMPNSNVELVYNIHDIHTITEKSMEKQLNLKKKESVELLCLGTIDKNKRHDLILKAIAKYPNKNLKLYIVGKVVEENYYQELLDIISKYKLENQVEFIPFLSNPYPLVKRVDALVSMSESEGLPGVVIESLILNTPTICTNSSIGIWEIMNNKDSYNKKLDVIVEVDKGIIIPNPTKVIECNMVENIKKSIDLILDNNERYKSNRFKFLDSVSDESIHSFYKILKEIM